MISVGLDSLLLAISLGISSYFFIRHFTVWALGSRHDLALYAATWSGLSSGILLSRLYHLSAPSAVAAAHSNRVEIGLEILASYSLVRFVQTLTNTDVSKQTNQWLLLIVSVLGSLTFFTSAISPLIGTLHTNWDGHTFWSVPLSPTAVIFLPYALGLYGYVTQLTFNAHHLPHIQRRTFATGYIGYFSCALAEIIGGITIPGLSVLPYGFMFMALCFDSLIHLTHQETQLKLAHSQKALTLKSQKLEEALCEVKRHATVKDRFISNISHEFRTPLTGILGLSELICRKDPTQEIVVKNIIETSLSLQQLVDNLLWISGQSTQRTLKPSWICPADLGKELRHRIKHLAQNSGLEFDVLSPSNSTQVYVDPLPLKHILWQLTDNAIKFTQAGHVSVQIYLKTPSRLIIRVEDTGIGIRPEISDRIFEQFFQADESDTRSFGGSGVGLTITRELVTGLNGDITLKSQAGQGSVFTVSLPIASRTTPNPHDASLQDRHILIVDDNDMNLQVIGHMVFSFGATFDTALDGQLAINACKDTAYDAIIMDIQMPVMDGFNATLAIRKAGFSGPIIALTATEGETARTRASQVGMDEFLTKPITPSVLQAALKRRVLPRTLKELLSPS